MRPLSPRRQITRVDDSESVYNEFRVYLNKSYSRASLKRPMSVADRLKLAALWHKEP